MISGFASLPCLNLAFAVLYCWQGALSNPLCSQLTEDLTRANKLSLYNLKICLRFIELDGNADRFIMHDGTCLHKD